VSPVPLPTRVFLACGVTDMRKKFDGLAVLVQQVLAQNPHSGALFVFRGKRGHLVKLLWFDGQGLCLFSKRLDRGRFVWPVTATGTVALTSGTIRPGVRPGDERPSMAFTLESRKSPRFARPPPRQSAVNVPKLCPAAITGLPGQMRAA
jgi:transposase